MHALERFEPARLTPGAPHVRNAFDVSAAMRCVLAAAAPCLSVALYNSGYQASLALAQGASQPGWRSTLLSGIGLAPAPDSPLACLAHGALWVAPLLGVSLLAGWLVERAFARARGREADHVALPVIALLFTLSLPAGLPLWQAALGCAVGVALGKEIFGGFGRNFVNPALTGLAFLYFSYPDALVVDATPLAAAAEGGRAGLEAAGFAWRDAFLGRVPGALGQTSALACLAGAALLLYSGVASWRILAGGALGLLAALAALAPLAAHPLAALPWHWHAVLGSFAFALVFLATDPVTAAVTNPGRWLYGLLIGALVVLVRLANPAHLDGALLAVLFANVSAPLLDQVAARALGSWRRLRAA